MKNEDTIRREVRDHYSAIARGAKAGCCATGDAKTASRRAGYSAGELETANGGGPGCPLSV